MKKWMIIGIHILLWSLLLISNSQDMYSSSDDYFNKAIQSSGLNKFLFVYLFNFCYILVFVVAFYGAYYLVGPFLFIRKKYINGIGYFILVLIAIVIARYLVEFQIILPYLKFHNYFGHKVELGYYIKNCIFFTYKYCLLGLVTYFLVASNRIEKEKKELEKEKAQAELLFLKSQINPHFLFNTINDIYSLTYRKDEQAPIALLKLSTLLRYMLYNENSPKILLIKELSYIEDFMDLVRIGNRGMIYIDYKVEPFEADHSIEPLLLIPMIENIFKHGVIDDPSQPASIHIQLKENQFQMKCSNYLKKQYKDQTGGIGLKNVRRRLELLYPETHRFNVQQKENKFNCSLELLL